MNKAEILELMNAVKNNEETPEEAVKKLKMSPFEDLGYAKIDYHRNVRQGTGEIIYGAGKTDQQIAGIVENMVSGGVSDILITRMAQSAVAGVECITKLEYDPLSKVGIANPNPNRKSVGNIVVASGGTSDMAVCEEAALTAEVLGNKVVRLYDVGVAGVHRLLGNLDLFTEARAVIAVAGMEGALPSVVGGLVD